MNSENVKSDITLADSINKEIIEVEGNKMVQEIPVTRLVFTAIASRNGRMETSTEVIAGLGGWEVAEHQQ